MAPLKRTSGAEAPAAKKTKIVAPEAPILDFIGKCADVPKQCKELLQVSVPICFEVVESDRHPFQVEVLDRVAKLVAGVESTKRAALSEAEGALAAITAEKEKAAAVTSEEKATTDAKKAECDEKGKVVDAAREVSNAALKVLKDAQKTEADFNKKKSGLLKEQESFGKLMNEVFEQLKANDHKSNWRQRNKHIAELQNKLSELGAQDSLADGLATTLKMTPEKRAGTFAKATIQFAQEIFDKQTAKIAQDISALDAEEASLKAAVAQEEATSADKKAALEVVDKEFDAMQDIWMGLDKTRAEAAKTEKQVESQLPRAQKNIDKAKADLEKFNTCIVTLFAHLKEFSTAPAEAEPEPEEEDKMENVEGGKADEADEAMQD